MFRVSNVVIVAAATAAVCTVSMATAEARPRCYPPISGSASSTGILGTGTANARQAARADFEDRASDTYGRRYGSLRNARGVRWDCKKGAILMAKCIVTASPCRD